MSVPRVLLAPLNVAGDPYSLSRALRARGVHADLATVQHGPFVAAGDVDLSLRQASAASRAVRKAIFCAHALRRYSVFHYSFGRSILDYESVGMSLLDLRVASRLGKVCVMTFHGCDVRGVSSGRCDWCDRPCDVSAKRRRLARIRRYVGAISVTTPDLLVDVPEAVWIPQAVDFVRVARHIPPRSTGPAIITHAPSDSVLKGTRHVVNACELLRERGWEIRLNLIENMSHAAALRAYEETDIAVDQLHAGWYGVFAIEMMAMGKPVVCHIDGAHARRASVGRIPLIDAEPSNLADVLESLLGARHELAELGAEGRRYALRVHAPDQVAGKYIELYKRADTRGRLHWSATCLDNDV